jgi:hypothetical protein
VARAQYAARTHQLDLALRTIHEAISAFEKTLGPDDVMLVPALTTGAEIALQARRTDEAYRWLSHTSEIEESNLDALLARGYEEEKQIALGNHVRTLNLAISLAVSEPENSRFVELTSKLLLQRKGRAQELSAAVYRSARARSDNASSDAIAELGDVRERIAHLILIRDEAREISSPNEDLRTLRQREEALESELAKLAHGDTYAPLMVSAHDIQEALPSNSAVVEIIEYRPFQMDGTWGPLHYAAHIIAHDKPSAWEQLGEATSLDTAIFSFRRSLHDANEDYREQAHSLYSTLWEPVRKHLGDASIVYLCPDGQLNLIPFAALIDGRNQFLIEKYALRYLNSARDLLRRSVNKTSGRVMIFADPDYGNDTKDAAEAVSGPRSGNLILGFRRLPGTRAEAQAIAEVMPGATVRLDKNASESAIKGVHSP